MATFKAADNNYFQVLIIFLVNQLIIGSTQENGEKTFNTVFHNLRRQMTKDRTSPHKRLKQDMI